MSVRVCTTWYQCVPLIAVGDAVVVVGGVREGLQQVGAVLKLVANRLLKHLVAGQLMFDDVCGVRHLMQEGWVRLRQAAAAAAAAAAWQDVEAEPRHQSERGVLSAARQVAADERLDAVGDALVGNTLLRLQVVGDAAVGCLLHRGARRQLTVILRRPVGGDGGGLVERLSDDDVDAGHRPDREAGRQPVLCRLKLGGDHAVCEAVLAAEAVQVVIADLLAAQVAQTALVDARVLAVEVGGDAELEERVADRLQPLQAEEVVRVRHRQRLQDEAGARPGIHTRRDRRVEADARQRAAVRLAEVERERGEAVRGGQGGGADPRLAADQGAQLVCE